MKRLLLLGACLGMFGAGVGAAEDVDADFFAGRWQEQAPALPAAPQDEAWIPFFVSAASDNRFFIDGNSLTVGNDGVIRYVLRVVTPGGARNVTFEGMRCESREWRVYATGRLDGSWSESRAKDWRPIQDADQNRQHAALFLEYFCPVGMRVQSREEALDALKRGGHPLLKR